MTEAPRRRPRNCPVCGKGPLAPPARFCSERCQAVDLGRWLRGDYAIPAEDEAEEDDPKDR
jgi:endogenous inhibitor of DNA gyrase (YacG/DUF329 family)